MKLLPLGILWLMSFAAEAQTPVAPAGAAMQTWIGNLDKTWEETYAREVTAPFDAEMTKLAQQYAAGIETNVTKTGKEGDLDATLLWRTERDRFAKTQEVPAEDEA